MVFGYPTPDREAACERRLADELEVSDTDALPLEEAGTDRCWSRAGPQELRTRDELARAHRRIKDLETELELVKAASAHCPTRR